MRLTPEQIREYSDPARHAETCSCPACRSGRAGVAAVETSAEPEGNPSSWTEAVFEGIVEAFLTEHGWRWAHFRPARTATGWRTAVSGDGKGFLDLICLRGSQLRVLELKAEAGKLTPDQKAWLNAWRQIENCEAEVVRPSDWPRVRELLA